MRVVAGYGRIGLGKVSLGTPGRDIVNMFKLMADTGATAGGGQVWTLLCNGMERYHCLIHEEALTVSRHPFTLKGQLSLLVGNTL